MSSLSAPLLTLSVIIPAVFAAGLASRAPVHHARTLTLAGLSATLVVCLLALVQVPASGGARLADGSFGTMFSLNGAWFAVDSLSAVLLVLFPVLALVTVAAAPQRDGDRRFYALSLIVVSATLATYAAHNVIVFVVGWTASVLPFVVGRPRERWYAVSRYTVLASSLALAVAFVLPSTSLWTLAAFIAAAILRTGLFPAHRGIVASLGGGGLLLSALVLNGYQGLYLLARFVLPLAAREAPSLLPWLGGLALLSCLWLAVLGLAEKRPEGLLATVIVSQACALFAGFTTRTAEGVTGALLQWIVLGLCSTVLIAVFRCLQVRTDGDIRGDSFNGFASATPRFAAMFGVAALALAGLPGTLGFSGEDLLMHGALVAHGWFGVVLPVAIALNAWHVYRLFSILFMGEARMSSPDLRDALPRERISLFAALALLVWLGFVPSQAVQWRAPAVRIILGSPPVAPLLAAPLVAPSHAP